MLENVLHGARYALDAVLQRAEAVLDRLAVPAAQAGLSPFLIYAEQPYNLLRNKTRGLGG